MNDLKQQLVPGWTAVNIGIIVVLMLFSLWPLSLLMVAYIIFGQKVGLDLSRPETLRTFGRRIGHAWRAAVNAFKSPT